MLKMNYVSASRHTKVHPEWRIFDVFVVENMHMALAKDSNAYAAPMTSDVNSPESIRERFSYVSSSKGKAYP